MKILTWMQVDTQLTFLIIAEILLNSANTLEDAAAAADALGGNSLIPLTWLPY